MAALAGVTSVCTCKLALQKGQRRKQTQTRRLSPLGSHDVNMGRRTLGWGAIGTVFGGLDLISATDSVLAAGEVPVDQFLPMADEKGFYFFKPDSRATPALRAGKLDPYSFWIPGSWHQDTVANALSGNYCQPRCGEPTVEVKFSNPKMGSLQVWISPVDKLTGGFVQGGEIKLEDLGDPEALLAALGPYVTGNTISVDDDLVEAKTETANQNLYYSYELFTPFAKTGVHNLASVARTGDVVIVFAVSASEKQWGENEAQLRTMVKSFRVA